MLRNVTLLFVVVFSAALFGAQGGPDQYGYIWKDSNEPDGPVYAWSDITLVGTLVSGLADDNTIGPLVMETSFQYYWYNRKFIWVGSNGYIAFNGGNIASPFPTIPTQGGTNDFVAAMMSDLTFLGAGNPAQCYFYDDGTVTTVSYLNVPFWSATAPNNYIGSNTFQIILNTLDSTITVQYQQQTGLTQNTDLKLGIESVAGSIGLQHSANTYPVANYAIRYYQPPMGLLDISDASITYNTAVGSGGQFLSRGGGAFTMSTVIGNIGNVDLADFNTTGEILNGNGTAIVSNIQPVGSMAPFGDTLIAYPTPFNPTSAGTFRFRTTISDITNELVTTNNQQVQELVVVDTTTATIDLRYHGQNDNGIGLSWDGGGGGVGVRITPPYYPAFATATTLRIVANVTSSAFTVKIFDDNGPMGTPGTLLDSVFVNGADATPGNKILSLSAPLTITDGSVYVHWNMEGNGVTIATDITPPFSLQTYEVLGGIWAEYRDRENVDFFLGLRLAQQPVHDIGCSGFFGVAALDDIGSPIAIRAFVHNYGNQPATGFPLSYKFGTQPVFTQTYSDTPIQPGQETLITFTQQLTPTDDGPGTLCAWTELANDLSTMNDTLCLNVSTWTGISDLNTVEMTVAPNPASDEVRIIGLPIGPYQFELFNAGGQLVRYDGKYTVQGTTAFSVASLEPGMYTLQLRSSQTIYRSRLAIQR